MLEVNKHNEFVSTLAAMEQAHKWHDAFNYIVAARNKHPDCHHLAIILIYFFMNLLLEEEPSDDDFNFFFERFCFYAPLLNKQFEHNVDYVFCANYIIGLAPWLCGFEDVDAHLWNLQKIFQKYQWHIVYRRVFFYNFMLGIAFNKYIHLPYKLYVIHNPEVFTVYYSRYGAFGKYMTEDILQYSAYRLCTEKVDWYGKPDTWENSRKRFQKCLAIITPPISVSTIDEAVDFVQKNPNNKKGYLLLLYFVVGEMQQGSAFAGTLRALFFHYHDRMFSAFGIHDHECNFYTGLMIDKHRALLGISDDQWYNYRLGALMIAEENLIFHWIAYKDIDLDDALWLAIAAPYADLITLDDVFKTMLASYGPLGDYVWTQMVSWRQRVLEKCAEQRQSTLLF